jgi:hypothetical protein
VSPCGGVVCAVGVQAVGVQGVPPIDVQSVAARPKHWHRFRGIPGFLFGVALVLIGGLSPDLPTYAKTAGRSLRGPACVCCRTTQCTARRIALLS